MRKYIKYEIKGNYRFILGILAIIIIASTIIQANILKEVNTDYSMQGKFTFMDFLLIVAVFVAFGSLLVAFFRIIGSFRKELYEDRGYLTFTLPLRGSQILGAKLIVAVLWILILGFVMLLYNLLLATILFRLDWSMLKEVFEYFLMNEENFRILMRIIPIHILLGAVSLFGTLILIFFSMALGRVSIRNRKIGGLWFIIFIIIATLSSYLTTRIGFELPLYFDLVNFRVSNMSAPWLNPSYNITANAIVEVNSFLTYVSITRVLSEVLVYIGAFISTGYLIENKIDL